MSRPLRWTTVKYSQRTSRSFHGSRNASHRSHRLGRWARCDCSKCLRSYQPRFTSNLGGSSSRRPTRKPLQREKISQRFGLVATMLEGDYLFGKDASVADAYLFTMLLWAEKVGLEVPQRLADFTQRMRTRPAGPLALKHEGLE